MTKLFAAVVAGLAGAVCWFHGRAFCDVVIAIVHRW
jgi:hypothetical protein